MQPPSRIVAHQQVNELEGCHVWVGPGWCVIGRQDQRHATDAPHIDLTFTILSRIQRVVPWQGPRRRGDRSKFSFDMGQHRSPIKFTRDDQRRIVGLVIKFVKSLEAINVNTFDIGAGANGALTVVVPLVHRRQRLREKHLKRVVFAALHFVADHGHLTIEIGFGDVAVHHGIGHPREVPPQVVLIGAQAGVIVRAVNVGGAIGPQASFTELGPGRGKPRRAFEQQVLEQVGHPGLAIVFVARPDAIGDVDGCRRLGVVRGQQDLQAIRESVLLDTFHAAHKGCLRGGRRGGLNGGLSGGLSRDCRLGHHGQSWRGEGEEHEEC